jgi:hypothetical protein
MSYSKTEALEYIFKNKFYPQEPQQEILFTRDEVRDAIIATGGQVPSNLNNFVKDLTRSGNSDPRSPSAKQAGYFLREGSHSGSMGVFFKGSGSLAGTIAVICPPDLSAKEIQISLPAEIFDLLRPDEGGVVICIGIWFHSRRFF